ALDDQPAVESDTWEVIDGKSVTIKARFRKFDNLEDAFNLHGKLLGTGSPYKAAMELVNDPDKFADALTGVYATDPQYGTTLKWVMDNYKLKQYDT
ncbi:MAG TPA: glucosaminidase domain-containing protein, partial [Reyranella sp.]|nr:glucosaminidase domain-containing protein [Reyranella sp.]